MKNTTLLSLLFFIGSVFFASSIHSVDDSEGGCSIRITKPCDEKENPDKKKDSDSQKDYKKKGGDKK